MILTLAAFGLGQLFGLADDVIGRRGIANLPNAGNATGNARQAADDVRNSALAGFLSLGLPALAASLGGWLGARTDDDAGDTTVASAS